MPSMCLAQGKSCSKFGHMKHFAKVCRSGGPHNSTGSHGRSTIYQLSLEDGDEGHPGQQTEAMRHPDDDDDNEVVTV
ncbi:hypothetical protein NDU88_001107 [Pleurodeles waltl]|uniref:Uncharacterized protein n=1 Tax=Pleurodeles waltl TaxID=8319 RepID=A0AAV7S6H0_PLEWA|nr:hypothetical protein NDU88_001107 [Pleurodeles waltl]